MAADVKKGTRFFIVNGPSRMDLMFSLFERRHPEPMYFEFSNLPSGQGRRLAVWLQGLSKAYSNRDGLHNRWYHASDSDDSWNPESVLSYEGGYDPHAWEFVGKLVNNATINPNAEVRGLFNSRTRQGMLEIL